MLDSISGPSGIKVRVGNFVVVPAVRSRVTSAKIEGQPGGAFLVTCLDGDISTIPLGGGSGQLLEAGQSVSISPRGELSAQKGSGVKSSGTGAHGGLSGRTGWTLLGVAGGGAGAAARMRQQEEEAMAQYTTGELAGEWEFKFLRRVLETC